MVVVGGGNAALCAALSAREQGASVLLLEKDTRERRGGNSKYTRNIRCATDAYPEEELLEDLVQVTGEEVDREMAEFAVQESRAQPAWMEAQGIRWQPAMRGTMNLERTNRFFLGGGKALVNSHYRRAEAAGVEIRYESPVEDVTPEGAVVVGGAEPLTARGRALVFACGGFEANLEWLRRYWGEAAANFIVRGSWANDGAMLAKLLELGAGERGNPRGFHAISVDARSPRYDGGIATRVDSVPLGIVVNREGRRFYDEREDIWPKRYAVWGRLIAEQPGQVAYSLYDSKVAGAFIPPAYPPYQAATVGDLAEAFELDRATVEATVAEFNAGSERVKLDAPPFYGFPLRPGITFTYLGVGVDRSARVLDRDGTPFPNLFAAGEIMAGTILRRGYLGGFGMTIGTVFGRIAGREAARHARAG